MEAALRGRELVRQMLTFSRKTEQEKKPLQLEQHRQGDRQAPPGIDALDRSASGSTLRSESGLILADPTQMQQVLMNLCTNAAHAMREKGGTLDIELSDFSVSPSDGNPHGIEPGPLHEARGPRYGHRHASRHHGQDIRPLLHHEEAGRGNGTRPLGRPRHREAVRRLHHRRERTRQRAPPSPSTSRRSQESPKPMRSATTSSPPAPSASSSSMTKKPSWRWARRSSRSSATR